jgi:hypothetical protein
VGSLNGRLRRLEGRIEPPQDTDEEKRRARVIAELQSLEARLRHMSPEEHKAWRESPEWAAEKEALEAELERRRRARHGGS